MRVELTTTGATSRRSAVELRPQRRRLDSNQRERALQARALPLGHVVRNPCPRHSFSQRAAQGSKCAASRFGAERSSTDELPARRQFRPHRQGHCVGKDSNLRRPSGSAVLQAAAIAAPPPTPVLPSQRGRIRTSKDRAPKARALPNCATRCRLSIRCSRGESNPPFSG